MAECTIKVTEQLRVSISVVGGENYTTARYKLLGSLFLTIADAIETWARKHSVTLKELER